MVSFNKTIQAGNLTRDPELRFTNDGIPVCEFGIAVNRIRSKQVDAVDFFDVTAWRELGETVANYKKKGDPILVEGRLTFSSWEAQDGSKRSKVTITAENVQFLGRNGNGEGGENGSAASSAGSSAGSSSSGGRPSGSREEPIEDITEADFEDIPFSVQPGIKHFAVMDIL